MGARVAPPTSSPSNDAGSIALAIDGGHVKSVCIYQVRSFEVFVAQRSNEHRLLCHITQTWRGKPLTSCLAAAERIESATTKNDVEVRCELDTRAYPKGIKVSDEEMDTLNINGDPFYPRPSIPWRIYAAWRNGRPVHRSAET